MKRSWTAGVAFLVLPGALDAQAGLPPALNAAGFPEQQREIEVGGRLEYNSNVLRGFGGVVSSGGRFNRRSDYILQPTVTVSLVQPVSRQDVFLSGTLGYNFYRYNKRLNRENINLTGGAHLRAGQRCTLTPAVSVQRALSDLGDLIALNGLATQQINTQTTFDYGADVSCGGLFGLTAGAGYHHQSTRNSSDTRRQLNVESDVFTGNVGLAAGRIGTFSAYGTYFRGRYPDRIPGSLLDSGDGISSYSAGLRYERQLGTFFYASVSGGYTHVAPRTSGTPGFNGISYSGDISYARDPLNLRIGFERNAEQSNLIRSAYAINTSFSVAGTYALNDRVQLEGSATYGQRRFIQAPVFLLLPGVNQRLSDRTYYGSIGASYRLTDSIRVGADVGYETRDSSPSIFDYSSTQVGIFLRAAI